MSVEVNITKVYCLWGPDELASTSIHALAVVSMPHDGKEIGCLAVSYTSSPSDLYLYRLWSGSELVRMKVEEAIANKDSIGRLVRKLREEHTTDKEEGHIDIIYADSTCDAYVFLRQCAAQNGGTESGRTMTMHAVSRWLESLQSLDGEPIRIVL